MKEKKPKRIRKNKRAKDEAKIGKFEHQKGVINYSVAASKRHTFTFYISFEHGLNFVMFI